MHPFFPSLPNHIRPQGVPDPTIQQAMLLNPNQFPSHGLNPQFPAPPMANFSNQNSNLRNFSGNPMGMPNQPFSMPFPSLSKGPDVLSMAQNNQMGVLPLPGPFGMNQAVALQLLGQQNLNFLASLQPGSLFLANNLPQNINPIVGLQNEQVRLHNLTMQGNQISALNIPSSSHPTGSNNPGFVGSPHMAMNNSNTDIGNVQLSVDAKKNTVGQSGKPILGSPMQNRQNGKNMLRSGHWQPQVNSIEGGERNVNSGNSPSKNFARNLYGYGKTESSRMRFQKSQFHHSKKANRSGGPINKPGRRGQDKWGEGNPQAAICSKPAMTGSKRCLPVNYTEKEIQQWREARRNNFPTRANIEKKLTGSGTSNEDDGDAKLRRRQLKEVLAKQAELGVEVAEVPPSYLSEAENHPENEHERKASQVTNRCPNKYSNKRGGHGRMQWNAKRPKFKNEAFTDSSPTVKKREPTLLQKLLSAEIKREKSQVLQVFRFMTLNSFLNGLTDKTLEFPEITVKDAGLQNETGLVKNPSWSRVEDNDSGASKNLLIEEVKCQNDSSAVDNSDGVSEED